MAGSDLLRGNLQITLLPRPARTSRMEWRCLFAIWAFATACNLLKPFHVDDTAHLEIARWILGHPLHPMSGHLNWIGVNELIAATNQPHLFFYLMAGWGWLFGFSEVAMHALQSLFTLASILLFFRLCRFLLPVHRMWVTAMFALCPALIISQNMMVDVPLVTFWLAFFNCVIVGLYSERQTRRYVLAGLLCTCALLVKYSSLVLLPVLALSLVMERRWRQLWTVLIPVAFLIAWSAFNVWDYGSVHIAARAAGSTDRLRPIKFLIAWLIIVGAVTPLGILAALGRLRLTRWTTGVLFVICFALALLWLGVAIGLINDALSDQLLLIAFIFNGAVTLIALAPLSRGLAFKAGDIWHRKDVGATVPLVILMAWLIGTTTFYILFPAFSATRHVLLILPPLFLLFGVLYAARMTRVLRLFGVGSTIVLTVGLAVGDFAFASFYRDAARQAGARLTHSPRKWTSSHWGWQWYSSAAGLRQVDYQETRFRRGDIFVEAVDIDHQYPSERLSLRPIGQINQQPSLANVFCTARPSRFYLSSSRFGPWSLSRNCLGHIVIYRVMKDYP